MKILCFTILCLIALFSPAIATTPDDCAVTIDFSKASNGTSLTGGMYLQKEWYDEFGLTLSASGGLAHRPRLFDTANPVGDPDLGAPNQRCSGGGPGKGEGGEPDKDGANCKPLGNVLIIQEDNDEPDIPDDNVDGGVITFHFDKPLRVTKIGLLDIDYKSYLTVTTLESGKQTSADFPIPMLGDNSVQTVNVDIENVIQLDLNLRRSGAVTFLSLCYSPACPEKVLYIHAYGVENPPPSYPPPEKKPARITRDNHAKAEAPLCMGATKDNKGQPVVLAELVYNRNAWTGGPVGRTDHTAVFNLWFKIIWAYANDYTKIKLTTHSNGVITAHKGWTEARKDIMLGKGSLSRSRKCPPMTVDMLHMQSAASEYTDLFPSTKAAEWQAHGNLRGGAGLLAEVTSVRFLFNAEDGLTWDSGGWTSSVGRREALPWVIDNNLAKATDKAIRGRASIACVKDDVMDHSGPESLNNCPPKNMATFPYNATDMKEECDYSLNDASFWVDDEKTPGGVIYQVW